MERLVCLLLPLWGEKEGFAGAWGGGRGCTLETGSSGKPMAPGLSITKNKHPNTDSIFTNSEEEFGGPT